MIDCKRASTEEMVELGYKLNELFISYVKNYGVVFLNKDLKYDLSKQWIEEYNLNPKNYDIDNFILQFHRNFYGSLFTRDINFILINDEKHFFADCEKAAQFLLGVKGLIK